MPSTAKALIWKGKELQDKVLASVMHGIDKTMSQAVVHAKQHHPGWQNRTGTAEGSVRIVQFAQREQQRVVGRWGSVDVNYVIWLELKHGSFLRSAADTHYPKLIAHIREALLKK